MVGEGGKCKNYSHIHAPSVRELNWELTDWLD
jgi:hypothetical protein